LSFCQSPDETTSTVRCSINQTLVDGAKRYRVLDTKRAVWGLRAQVK
jgi:hypothetical protein